MLEEEGPIRLGKGGKSENKTPDPENLGCTFP